MYEPILIKIENQKYGISRVFAPLTAQGELEIVCKVLRKIAEICKQSMLWTL